MQTEESVAINTQKKRKLVCNANKSKQSRCVSRHSRFTCNALQFLSHYSWCYFIMLPLSATANVRSYVSAKFIPKQLLQSKPYRNLNVNCLHKCELFDKTFHIIFITTINADKITNVFVDFFVNVVNLLCRLSPIHGT